MVFKDDENLYAGEEIKPELKEAIQQSRISIAVFSKDYASSKSCLMELVEMWECRESKGQTIIPIFYDVSPMDVKHQAGDFERSFNLHELDGVNSNTIKKWKQVLRKIAGLSGFGRELINGGHESQLVEKVVARVRQLLKMDDQLVTDKLVGIDHHVDEMMRKLGVAYSEGQVVGIRGEEVRVVGICGMPGVGKTTLAKVVFNKMHKLFDAYSFLEGVSLEGIQFAQQILIADLLKIRPKPLKSIDEGIQNIADLFSDMKVLIVLDDVREDEQIKALAGKLTWFGLGSRIIVTTTKRNVLNAFDDGASDVQTVEEYKLEPMSDHHALQLFREHAFAGEAPEGVSEYDSLSIDIVKAIGGLPLDVARYASFLRSNRNIRMWKTTLDLLQEKPRK
ncbi:TMV resistance protein N-like [Syzygium oleosum]|uniref:TMV resistance protein N-like n=1 Tax=Syzygium oleosum TaxID=219896 RepID=UPI0024B8DFCD|nr:TMV resistance protein N-like [Syzygium oleosum]